MSSSVREFPSFYTASIPYEITAQVFVLCLPLDGRVRPSTKCVPLLLAQICRRWRDIALSIPRLWASIALGFNHACMGNGAATLMNCWFARAGACPVSITVHNRNPERRPPLAKALLSAIKSYSARWWRLELKIRTRDIVELLESIEGLLPLLRVVALQVTAYDDIEGYCRKLTIPLITSAPNLRVLRLSPAFAGYFSDVAETPPDTVRVLEFSMGGRVFGTELFRVLSMFPNLRSLNISTPFAMDPMETDPPNRLPPLRSLTLYDLERLLDVFTLPTLTELTLMNASPNHLELVTRFIMRSACALTHITLDFHEDYRGMFPELPSLLATAPTISTLELRIGPSTVSAGAFRFFHSSTTAFLPRLQHFRLKTAGDPDTWNIILELVEARAGAGLLEMQFTEYDRLGVNLPLLPLLSEELLAGFDALATHSGMCITLESRIETWCWPMGRMEPDECEEYDVLSPEHPIPRGFTAANSYLHRMD